MIPSGSKTALAKFLAWNYIFPTNGIVLFAKLISSNAGSAYFLACHSTAESRWGEPLLPEFSGPVAGPISGRRIVPARRIAGALKELGSL